MRTNSSFPLLLQELGRRWKAPVGQVSFWVYLAVSVLGVGAIGIWVEVSRAVDASKFDANGLVTAIYTYFPAIAAGSALQLMMDASKEEHKFLRSFCVASSAIVVLLTLPFFRGSNNMILLWLCGVIGILYSLWLWWITNGCSGSFQDIDPNDSLGSSPHADLTGDTGGFNL
ncbi:MAG TPA: hypothetical protein PKW52_14310 [Nitrospira sp.]|nr:hypothetical protein [Nitrospira sp.]